MIIKSKFCADCKWFKKDLDSPDNGWCKYNKEKTWIQRPANNECFMAIGDHIMDYFEKNSQLLGYKSITNNEIWHAFSDCDKSYYVDENEEEPDHFDVYGKFEEKYYNEEHYKEWTEVVLVLNWKMWERYECGDQELSKRYNDLWADADRKGCKLVSEDGVMADYFYGILD